MSAREIRMNLRKWHINKAKQREQKKHTSLLSTENEVKNNPSNSGRKKMRRDRTKLHKENIHLKIENKKLLKKVERLRKLVYRSRISSEKKDIILTPNSKMQQFMKTNFPGIKTPEI